MRGFFGGRPRTPGLAAAEAAVTSPICSLRDVEVRLGGRAILDVPDLAVLRGEVLAIIGPNGAGKSTLLQVLALLQRPIRGEVSFAGQTIHYNGDLLTCRRRMAVVFQEPLLLDTSVQENVATGLKIRGVPRAERERRVGAWLDRLDILHLARRSARTLSGGESQRTSLARALVLQPDVLLLDEPFGALDAPSKAKLLDDLERVLRETGVTTILVTHDRSEALALGHRVAVMFDGRILQLDTPERVFSYPATEEVAAFVGVETIMSGVVADHMDGLSIVLVGEAKVQVARSLRIGQRVLLCVRPEQITLAKRNGAVPKSSARNLLDGTVSRLTLLGTQYRVVVDCGFPLVATVTRQSLQEMGLSNGSAVNAIFKATGVHVIPRE